MTPEATVSPAGTTDEADRLKLHEMGYAQELRRRMGGFSNFAVSFTIISILSGCLTLYGFGMSTGGPVVMTLGWPIVGLLVILVGLSMAEVCSSYPTAGGLYYWAAKLAPQSDRNPAAWSWFCGWFNLLGQVAVTAGIDFGAALFLTAFLNLTTGFSATPHWHIVLIYAAVLIIHGLLNTFGVRVVAFLSDVSVWWHILGVLTIVIALAVVPAHHQSASFVFTHFVNNTGFHGWGSAVYVFFIGLLVAQYTFTGYDASAHMTEETRNPQIAGPRGIVMSIVVSLVAGWILLIGVTFAIQNYTGELTSATGVPPAQIFIDAVGRTGGELLLLVAIVAQLFCGMASVTANSRMIYAFSRDGAVPGSKYWHRINKRTGTPTNSIWFAVVFAFILGVPYIWSPVAYAAVTSIAVIGLYIAYIIPIFLRLRAKDRFEAGPWNLGRKTYVIGYVATIWVLIICVLFMLPELSPITKDSFNYAPIAVGVVLILAGGWWFISAKNWFTGPKVQGSADELAEIESELERV
ncbi:MAG TPA: amino acid permease [Acidimicrobiales bacterium]|jgi:amino acid permease (GABA permease)|nr:amino acid permease [Acidimicrobiales bacterium]